MKNATNGDTIKEKIKIQTIFNTDVKRLNAKLSNGAARIKKP